jgi:hypothetical protein
MLYKGMRFTRSHKVVPLPRDMWISNCHGEPDAEENLLKNYVMFGRTVHPDKAIPKNAVQTDHHWEYCGRPVWAVPVKVTYHSLTNMPLGKDGYWYLMFDGCCYVCKRRK